VRLRSGFTLVELLAALSISGLAMLGGVMLVDQVTDGVARIVRRGRLTASEGNGPRVLRQLLLDARVTADTVDRFRGDERLTEFSTLCRHPGGWTEQCRVAIAIDRRNDTSVVMAAMPSGEKLEVMRRPAGAELRYFDATRGDSAWVQRWALSITMPVAIGVVTGNDTLIYPLGTARE
jgi:prepilin-type N-terminal cleavage/methylation domain-containing protein